MRTDRLRRYRLRSHRLSAPAATLAEAGAHMTALQSQEFWGGRWALAARTRGAVRLSDVDAAFERGELVRSWTMRGTLHIVAPADLGWILSVTADRQHRQAAAMHRDLGITADTIAAAERAVRPVLAGGNRLTRSEFAEVLASAGIEPAGMRGNHLLAALCLELVVCLGPVVPREGAPTRDQYVVAVDDWIAHSPRPADPAAELFVRFIGSHGPASAADFGWWAGLPLGLARAAAAAAGDRVTELEEGLFASAGPAPRRHPSAPGVLALPPFEEYYLSYVDRTVPCAPEFTARIGPSLNGIVRPVLVADGEIVGVWSHSVAVGKHRLAPVPEVFAGGAVAASDIEEALRRYARFIAG